MEKCAERPKNIGDDSLPKKLKVVGADHPDAENPIKTGCLTVSRSEPEFFDEPVWRKERTMAINQHFITAFLDLNLKGDESKRGYLHVSPALSNEGKWPLPPGASAGAKVSDGTNFWKGFQRRWALGMSMTCTAAIP